MSPSWPALPFPSLCPLPAASEDSEATGLCKEPRAATLCQGRGEGGWVERGSGQGFTTSETQSGPSTFLPLLAWWGSWEELSGWRQKADSVGGSTPPHRTPPSYRGSGEGPVLPSRGHQGRLGSGHAPSQGLHPAGRGTKGNLPGWVGFSPTDFPERPPDLGWGWAGHRVGAPERCLLGNWTTTQSAPLHR